MPNTILIVDDEKDILEFLKYNLETEGYGVLIAHDGIEALKQAEQVPSLILLDVMMPELDGWETARRLKRNPETKGIPIIFLTARNSEKEEIAGLNIGAEDYITKPISIPKLLARIAKSISRATGVPPPKRIALNKDFIIDVENYAVIIDGKVKKVPKREFETLVYLLENANKVVSRQQFLQFVWGEDVYVVERTIDVRIRNLRKKLGKYADFIETIKGVGYRFNKP